MSHPPLFTPFAGWLVRPEWAARVVAGAYDSKTPEQRRAAVQENPYSYFGVTRSSEDAPPGVVLDDAELLAEGAATLSRILDSDAFAPTGRSAFYAYQLSFDGHDQTGIVGALDLNGFGDARVHTHENVRPERAQLLGHHLEVVGATSSPISLTHVADDELRTIVARTTANHPDLDHVVEGVQHRVWTISEADTDAVTGRLDASEVYVTDGHHRSAAALAGRARHPFDPTFARTLAVVFPDDELRVEAFHRRAPDRDQRSIESLIEALSTTGSIDEVPDQDNARPRNRGEIGVYAGGRWFRLDLDPLERPDTLASLDVERLRRDIIGHVLGVDELQPDSEVDYVPAPTGVAELVRRCDLDGRIGFVVFPTAVTDLMAVARAGDLMPPKSSYFAPKPRSGVFLRVIGCGATAHLPPS